jgi:hypothetical protein
LVLSYLIEFPKCKSETLTVIADDPLLSSSEALPKTSDSIALILSRLELVFGKQPPRAARNQ